jgi:hypothetical protein
MKKVFVYFLFIVPLTTSFGQTPTVLPRPDFHYNGQVGRTILDSDPAQFPQPVQASQGAPLQVHRKLVNLIT